MSDPNSKTVRGWLVDLIEAVSAGANAELLAEVRYMNQRLWGSDATNPQVNQISLVNLLSGSLYVNEQIGSGPAAPIGIAEYLRYRLLPAESYTIDQRLLGVTDAIQYLREDLRDEAGNILPGARLEQILAAITQLRLNVGTGTSALSVQGLLAAIQQLANVSNELNETYGNAQNAALVGATNLLQCICDNTGEPGTGPSITDPCNVSPYAPAYTARVTSWGTDSYSTYHATSFEGLPPGDTSNSVPNAEEFHFRTFDDWDICTHYEGETVANYHFEIRTRNDNETTDLVAYCTFNQSDSAQSVIEAIEQLPTGNQPWWHFLQVVSATSEPQIEPTGTVWIEFWEPI